MTWRFSLALGLIVAVIGGMSLATDPPPPPALSLAREPAFNPAAPLLGRVRLLDADGIVLHQWTSPQPNDLFGLSAILLPDVNGDGVGDVAIGAPNAFDDVAGARVGTVVIQSGADGSTIATISGTPLERFGLALHGASTGTSTILTVLVQHLDPATGQPITPGGYTFQSFDAFTGALVTEAVQAPAGFTAQAAEDSLATYIRAAGPADLNASGEVTPSDFTILANNFGATVDPITGQLLANDPTLAATPVGDTNGDGVVDGQDVAAVAGSMGQNFEIENDPLTEAEAIAVEFAFAQATPSKADCKCGLCPPGWCMVRPGNIADPVEGDPPAFDDGDGATVGPIEGGSGGPLPDSDGDGVPDSQDSDDDGDGIRDGDDCDHGAYGGNPGADIGCQDDNNDGVRNQNDCGHSAYYRGEADPERVGLDLRADFDEDDDRDDTDEEYEEDSEPLVVLATTGDTDGDGWPDFADGFDFLPDGFPPDDAAEAAFTRIDVIITDPRNASIQFDYPAADPNALDLRDPYPYDPDFEPQVLRLWTKPGTAERDPRPVTEGGDYIPPGEYELSDLGIHGCKDSNTALYLEAVSAIVDDASYYTLDIAVGGFADSIRVVPVSVDLISVSDPDHLSGTPVLFVAPTLRYSLDDVPDTEALELYEPSIYRFVVRDVRGSIAGMTFGGLWLPITWDGHTGYTDAFWIDEPGDVIDPNPGPEDAIAISGAGTEEFDWEYNPESKTKKLKFPKDKDPHIVMLKLLDEATDAMELDTANTWLQNPPYEPSDSGAFGKEVHKRMSARLLGQPRWVTSIWIHVDTGQVISIGPAQPTGYQSKDIFEVDAVKLKKGKAIVIGSVFNAADAESIFEIKGSASGILEDPQLSKYNAVIGESNYHTVNPKRRYSRTYGWVDHPRGIEARKLLGIFKAAKALAITGGVMALIFPRHDLEERANDLVSDFRNLGLHYLDPAHGAPAVALWAQDFASYTADATGQDVNQLLVSTILVTYYNVAN